MAEIVVGLGTSHTPQLSTPPEKWHLRAEGDVQRKNLFRVPDGVLVSYEELLAGADPAIKKEINLESFSARHERNQRGVARVAEALAEADPDILVMVGDDQKELFHEDNMPVLCVYWGDEIPYLPRHRSDAASQASAWAHPDEAKSYPVASELSKHIIGSMMEHKVDVAHSQRLREGQSIGHAFTFILGRLMNGKDIPVVPVMQNTYYPPNQPTPERSYEIGMALGQAIKSWKSDARVGIIGSGGFSHFVVDEEVDWMTLNAMQEHDRQAIYSLPRHRLNAGTSEIRNWITVAGACEGKDFEVFDYVPGYRSEAGTGCSSAFGRWK